MSKRLLMPLACCTLLLACDVPQITAPLHDVEESMALLGGGVGVTMLDLGALQPGGFAAALDINNDGYVVGYSGPFPTYCCGFIPPNQRHAFLWDPNTGAMRDIGVSLRAYGWGINSNASAIAADGWIAGDTREAYWASARNLFTTTASDVISRPPWDPSNSATWTMTIHPPFVIPFSNQFEDINSAHVVVGYDGRAIQALPPSYDVSVLPTPLPGASGAHGINEQGQIAGWGAAATNYHPLRWSASGVPEDIGLPPGTVDGRGMDINDAGAVAGHAYGSGAWSGFVWDPVTQTFSVLPSLGGSNTYVYGMNNAGKVVGSSQLPDGSWHGFAWDPATGVALDLGTLPGDAQSEARSINDRDQVVGKSYGSGNEHAVLWTVTFTPPNAAPTADPGGPYTGDEGTLIAFSGTGSSDPDGDVLTYSWDFGDGSVASDVEPSHTYADNGTYVVTLTVTDSNGAASEPMFISVTVANVSPTITALSVPGEPFPVGSVVELAASFSDPSAVDTHLAGVDWDDGAGPVGATVNQASQTVSATRTFTTAGVYAVNLVVADDDGGSGTANASNYIVVYDPSAGFVTGGGWINSPAGACLITTCTVDTSGKATFGFVSRYQRGAATPSGNTEFHFHAGALRFSSSSYQWLVVADSRAQFKGDGKINGGGAYGFMITAIDGNQQNKPDAFRIKIWDVASGTVVYDNKMGAAEDSDDATALESGNIVIHR